MGTAGLGLVLGGLFVVGRGCLPWWCRLLRRVACWRVVLRVCPAWPACGARSLPGCAVAQARGHTLSLAGPFGFMAGPVGARLWPAARQWDVCPLGGGGLAPLPSPSPPCYSVPFRRPALPAYPLRTRWVGLGWTVGLGGLTWCFFPAGRRGLGSLRGRVARVVCRAACMVSWAPLLLFTRVHALCVVLRLRCPRTLRSCSPVCTLCVWCCVCGVLGRLTPVHRCARSVCGVLCVRCPGPPGSCSPVCTFCVWCCVYGVLGLLAPVHRCARSVCGVACTASWASRLLFTGVPALCVVLRVRCPGPLGYCSPVFTLCVWCCGCRVLGHLAPVHRCARSVCGVVCAVSWAAWPLFTGVPALVCYVVCTVSCAPWLRFTGVHALCAVLCVRRPGPLCSCSPVRVLVVLCRLCRLLGCLAPVHRRARSVCGVVCVVSWPFGAFLLLCSSGVSCLACVVSWDTWVVFSGVAVCCAVCAVQCAVLRVRCPGPPGPCSPVRTPGVWCCVGGVLGRLAGGRGVPGSLACGRSFGFGRGLVDEVGGEWGGRRMRWRTWMRMRTRRKCFFLGTQVAL